MSWLIISTWEFSFPGIVEGSRVLADGGSALLAVEKLVRVVEDDPSGDSVGFGGFPNREGDIECDAAIMDGSTLSFGAVAALRSFRHAISVARCVMEDTPHNMLAGQGADEFAIRKGFSRELLLNEAGIKDYYDRKARINDKDQMPGHDTVGVVALDRDGNMACGTSTSGLAMKYRGRVGDSPLIGSGFYVDNNWGGACCTGVGEDIMRGCTAFAVINGLQQGMTPDDAAIEAIRNTHTRIDNGKQPVGKMALVCADRYGNYGASSNHSSFEYCIAGEGMEPNIVKVAAIKGLGMDTV